MQSNGALVWKIALGPFEKTDSSRLYIVNYDEFVESPFEHVGKILEFIGVDCPSNLKDIVPDVRKSSLGKGYKQLDNSALESVLNIVGPVHEKLETVKGCEVHSV